VLVTPQLKTNFNFKEDEITATSSKISVDITSEEMEKKCVIFKCENLSNYQKAVNDAAIELAKKDGSLLLNKGKLFETAREKVFADGYHYAKKESRSKYFGAASKAPKAKRKYTSESIRSSRIQDIQESITSITDTINLLIQQKQQYVNTEKFLQAAEINTTILEKNKAKRDLERELANLSKAKNRSKDYHVAKKKKRGSSKGSSSQSSLGEQGQKSSESGDTEAFVSSDIDSNDEVDPPFTSGGSDDEFDPPPLVRQNAMPFKELQALVREEPAPIEKNENFSQDPQ
jgi:hypothetical protein